MRKRLLQYLFAGVAMLAMGSCSDDSASSPDAMPDAIPLGNFGPAHMVFEAKCAPCHSTDHAGGHNLGSEDTSISYLSSQQDSMLFPGRTIGSVAMVRILDGSMPKGKGCTGDPTMDSDKPDCLTQLDIDAIRAWLDEGQPVPGEN